MHTASYGHTVSNKAGELKEGILDAIHDTPEMTSSPPSNYKEACLYLISQCHLLRPSLLVSHCRTK